MLFFEEASKELFETHSTGGFNGEVDDRVHREMLSKT